MKFQTQSPRWPQSFAVYKHTPASISLSFPSSFFAWNLSHSCPQTKMSSCMNSSKELFSLELHTHCSHHPAAGSRDELNLGLEVQPLHLSYNLLYNYFLVIKQVWKPREMLSHSLHNPCLFKKSILNITQSFFFFFGNYLLSALFRSLW